MAKQVQQFRYYSNNNNKNQPNNISKANLVSGSIFSKYMPVVQLGIQSLPGTKFFLNNSNDPVIIGNTGIYELNINGLAKISSIQFEGKSIDQISRNNNASLIVDIIYEGGE